MKLKLQTYWMAAQRRLSRLVNGDFDPYPAIPGGLCFSPSQRIDAASVNLEQKLDWSKVGPGDIQEWQQVARVCLRELLLLPDTVSPPEVHSEAEMPITEGYERRRVYLRFGPGCDAPVDIVYRSGTQPGSTGKVPVLICMQGTNSGAHLNLGEVRMPADVDKVARGSALALQAADRGYIAISFERACFGERRELHLEKRSVSPTVDTAVHMLTYGETLLGRTVTELEALHQWIMSDVSPGAPVYLVGYSAAGTAAIAAAAAIPGIAGIAVGGCVGMIQDTILRRGTSGHNEIPDILKWFEYDALFSLIAPRPCVVVAGITDHIWPYSAGEKVISSARPAWEASGQEDRLKLVRAPRGHTYYPELMWPAIEEVISRG
jgi:hypothetical protein